MDLVLVQHCKEEGLVQNGDCEHERGGWVVGRTNVGLSAFFASAKFGIQFSEAFG